MSIDRPVDQDRYKNNPFLRLLDCYILDAIGELRPEQKESLEKLEPRLQETLNAQGSWREIVEDQMDFLPTVAVEIEMSWAGYREHEERLGHEVTASSFVRDFVAQNFPALAEDDPQA